MFREIDNLEATMAEQTMRVLPYARPVRSAVRKRLPRGLRESSAGPCLRLRMKLAVDTAHIGLARGLYSFALGRASPTPFCPKDLGTRSCESST